MSEVLKVLSFEEDLVFRAACRGVGTFRLGSSEEELRVLKEVYEEVCNAHGKEGRLPTLAGAADWRGER